MSRSTNLVALRFKFFAFATLALWLSLGKPGAQSVGGVSAPVLMWQYGGCIAGPYCQTGWYSSPVVADLDGDGQPEVIWGAYDVVALNGATGSLKWRSPDSSRVWSGIVVADLTGDGTPEVIVGRDSDKLTVYNRFGSVIWLRNPFGGVGELRTLAVADLEQDGRLEIIVGHAAGVNSQQVNVFAPDGTVRLGWPARRSTEPGFGGGMWNANVAVGDMNGDGFKELFGAHGAHYIDAFDRNGNQLPVNGIYAPRQFWSVVGVAVDNAAELRGYVDCGVEHRPDFSASAPVIADVNGDAVPELIVVGNVRNCATTPYTDLYHMPFIFKLDRTRWSGSGFNWTTIPTPGAGSAPRSQDSNVIEGAQPNAIVADLDGDGFKEILFPSYDGKLHAYWLDKTAHGNWPYRIPTSGSPGDDFRFASEPIVADLDNDGRAEVIFTSWPKRATGRVGQIHILNYLGAELYRLDLPAPSIGKTWNGSLSAPTIANIDSDPNLELVLGTVVSGVVAYKLPNTTSARILWGTGRADYGRTGDLTAVVATEDTTPPMVSVTSPATGATVSRTVTVTANASDNVGVAGVQFKLNGANLGVEDTTVPYSVSWDTLTASNGSRTLTAVARDAAGNTATSAAVTVTVANDTTAPTVSVTSPATGATVSRTVTVTANASDNVGVVGVQFKLNGANLGVEDTTAPYSVSWDTLTASNGSRTLTAVARDAAGNTATSAAVTVTVANDTTAPSVSMASPANGATVSRTVTVTANASDNVGVTGVQFKLDGANLGVEDTTAPYSISWDTTTASNAPHTLTAVARDAAGNTATSAAVTVTVANSTGSPIRIEDTTTAVSYFNNWTLNHTGAPGGWSGGSVAFGWIIGSRATLNFTGTGVSWIGSRGPYVGIANVYLDGTAVATVDGYAPTETVQAVLYTSPLLAAGSHTLAIEATQTKNPNASDYLVLADAFDVTGAPPDTTPPTNGITAPTTGATVSGTVTVTANASDNVAVAGVQFLVDGSPLGAEDTSVPYAVTWNTTTVPDGAHALTAVARDLAGNTASSAGVAVIVSNAAPPTTTRFENTDLGIRYTPGTPGPGQPHDWWHGSRSRDWSGDTASFNRSAGARATFTFTGTSVSWIGYRAAYTGIARVYVDGTFVTELDLYSTTEQVQTPIFTALNLSAGSHTLTVESTGRKNDAAVDYAVVVDAFDVSPGSPPSAAGTRLEETAPSTSFTSGWTLGDATKPWSGGTAAVSATPPAPGARATFTFIGTSVSWIGLRGPRTGIARVYLDGAFQATVDTYSPTEIQAVVYTATTLAAGRHTLALEVTGQKNAAATDSRIYVDAFDIRSRFEETDPAVTLTGGWTEQSVERAWSETSVNTGGGTAALAATAGARAEFAFAGTAVSWIGFRGPWVGVADVFVDGGFVSRVDLYAPTEQVQVPVFTATGLSAGTHTLRIDVTGQKNAAATAAWVVVDGFDAVPTPAPAITRVQETDPSIVFTADWTPAGSSSLWSGVEARMTGTVGGRVTFTFTGRAVRWIGERGFGARARVSLDGLFIEQIDTRAPLQVEYQAALFSATGLTPGSHTLTIEVVGRNNEPPGATVEWVVVDAFDVY